MFLCPLLVGSSDEISRWLTWQNRWRSAIDGHPQFVFLGGEAGAGKSRLLAEHLDQARLQGVEVLLGACHPISAGALPYGPLAAALRGVDRHPALRTWLDPTRIGGMSSVFPLLADSDPDSDGTSQVRMFELLLGMIGQLTSRTPTILAVEDAHWSDLATLDALIFLLRNVTQERLQVVVTYRSDELALSHPLRNLLALGAGRHARRLILEPLDTEAMHRLVADLLPNAEPERWAEIAGRCGGNPFLAEELSSSDGLLPETLRDHVASRIAPLPPIARRLLQALAAGGLELPLSVLDRVCGDAPEAALATRLAVSTGLVQVGPTDDRLRFRHVLLGEVIYDDMLPAEKRQIHAALAEALLVESGDHLGSETAGAIAAQWLLAGRPEEAQTPILVAARSAARRQAYADAALLFERAVALRSSRAEQLPLDGTSTADLYLEYAESVRWTGELDRAVELATIALAQLPPSGRTLTESSVWERLAHYHWERGDGNASLAAGQRACAVLVDQGPSRQRARALGVLGGILMLRGDFLGSKEVSEQAVAMAREVSAVREVSDALNTLGVDLASTGDIDAGIDALQEALGLARSSGALEDVCRAYYNLAHVLEIADRLEEALDAAIQGLDFARRYGLEHRAGALLKANAATVLITLGRWTQARTLLTAGTERDAPRGHRVYLALVLLDIDIAEGDPAAAATLEAWADRVAALNEPWSAGLLAACRAEVLLWAAQPLDALPVTLTALDSIAGSANGPTMVRLAALAMRALADARDPLRLFEGRTEEWIREKADRIADYATSAPREPSCRLNLMQMAAERQRAIGEPAGQLWDELVDAADTAGWPYLAAYATYRRAEVQQTEHHPDSDRTLNRAAEMARALGAVPLLKQVEMLAARNRVNLGNTDETPTSRIRKLALTKREQEVLALVMQGASNRQISRALHITEKTASVHVSNINSKLGVSSRGQAAALGRRLGLLTE